ncbi:MAG: YggS family pyridoxal phosphate-dependent enzyme [Ferrovum sp.]|nr:YggS family pyridoxal phosphate-dependent enzyme [Ferrovum sp.]NDU87840.1 YggS family pyridoxal phosphate-dependent enzyme [Ferrovum sp.]
MFDVAQWNEIQHRIDLLAPARDVTVVAVSKGQPVAAMRAAVAAGVTALGESYVQEALDKRSQLMDLAVEWHFVGRIQSNKTTALAQNFDWVHGVMDERQAQRLSRAREAAGEEPLQICLQVNVSGEPGKAGIAPELLEELAAYVTTLPGLRLRGLMALPEVRRGEGVVSRSRFAAVRQWKEGLERHQGVKLDTLSMGMSGDYELALEEGATLLRLGTALFGSREK